MCFPWCIQAEDGSVATLYLNDLEVFAKDYLRGAGIQGFEKKLNEYNCEVRSEYKLRQTLPFEQAKRVAIGLFDLKVYVFV